MTTASTPMSPDSVAHYLSSIGIYPLLTADEEVELAQLIEAGTKAAVRLDKEGDSLDRIDRLRLERSVRAGADARQRFLNSNLRLVVSQAKRYRRQTGIDFIDLIQEGNLGLIRAVDKFDWRKGFKFSTYATWWIRQAITRALAEKSRTLRIPGHLHDKIITLQAASTRFQAETGREPTTEELAEESGIDSRSVEEAMNISDAISLESPIGEDGATISDFVQSFGDDDPELLAEEGAVSEDLRSAIERLDVRERDILLTRFGFADGVPRTHEEIGKGYGLTPERIRQIEKLALSRLRHPSFGLHEDALV